MEMAVSVPRFHRAYISSQYVGFSEAISPAAVRSLLNAHAVITTEINFLETTPK